MNNYSREEVFKSTLEYFNGDTFATDVWINKYSLKEVDNNTNEIIFHELNPNDMFKRIVNEILRIEEKYKINKLTKEEILELIKDFKYIIPQGGSLSGIGNNYQIISLSNCFVIGSDLDSYGSIFQTDQEQVQLMKRRGGVGHDLSALRPKGTKVNNSALTSSGIVPFMDRYSNSTKEVAQDGRRGALMLSIDVTHPQAEDFIDAKLTEGKITAANISVKLTDEFMNAVFSDKKFIQQFPVNSQNPKIKKEIDPKQIWKKIIYNAWKSAEPGVLFWDQIIRESVADCYNDFKTVSTNPCISGETHIMCNDFKSYTVFQLLNKFKLNEEIFVFSYNFEKQKSEFKRLENIFLTKTNCEVIKLTFDSGQSLIVTHDHKIFTQNGKKSASELKVGDICFKTAGYTIEIDKSILEKIEFHDNIDVFDLTVADNHNFFANGILISNCGEIPLCPYDSCRLLAINLYNYVENPFTENVTFKFDLFADHVKKAVRIMDDIIDLEIEKIDKIIDKIKNDPEESNVKQTELVLWTKIKDKAVLGRRMGIGITAEGDMLAAMNLIYGTEKATDFAVKIQKILAVEAYKESIQLAKERGCFTIWNEQNEIDNPFLQRIFNEISKYIDGGDIINKYKKYGRRNISMLTIAPTGSVSTLTQTTSGIEPAFLISYKRRRKINQSDKNVKVDFVDKEGIQWEEYNVFHHKFEEWLKVNNYDIEKVKGYSDSDLKLIIEKSPYFKATSADVNWLEKVKMQGQIQQWVDHSISCTVNLPNSATQELISDVYKTAWEYKCKGITVYRDGSRQGILITNEPDRRKLDIITKTNAPKRPEKLRCDIHQITAKGQEWIVIVGMMNGGDNEPTPYEVFAFKKKNIAISPKMTKGILKRKKSGYYNLEIENLITLENITELFEQDEEEALTRQISLSLRHGVDIKFIVEQLNKAEGTIASFSKAVMRALKKYIENETEVKGEVCPKCSSKLVYSEGCVKCSQCDFSKCG